MFNPNQDEYKSRVGLKDLYIAPITTDAADDYVVGTPEYLAPAAEASATPAVNRSTQYADDRPFDTMSAEGETEISLTVTSIPLEVLSAITGRVFDAASGRMYDNAGTPGYFALGFRSKKSNGKYRYYWFLKGRFDMPGEEFASQGDSPDPKPVQLTYTAVKTTKEWELSESVTDGVKRIVGDEDTTNFVATGWFTQVQTPDVVAADALALSSSVPADAATGVAVGANQSLTFNNALVTGAENHVTLLDGGNESVEIVTALSENRKTITIDPTDDLSASTDYTLVIAGVTDVFGQRYSGTIEFTTAA